ncbi:hypothetical protein CSZ94_24435 [Janthinobacterium sp. ROICE36]|uniref:hypothetical protein n=1 Tax=Janthinobacterium sp. ROICE36 TaxID=2048670 RepID=UPI000C7ECE92|nr:hypothetical protein [Janthinobacterium sp. ROICE36]PLY39792.1 hypothetical protein CSZ94_24435 [Janthinobacterium sp. ROICE36]
MQRGTPGLWMDGHPQSSLALTLADDGRVHNVVLRIAVGERAGAEVARLSDDGEAGHGQS